VLRSVTPGTPLSLLGIDLSRRIRHRINGVAVNSAEQANATIRLKVLEYSPNCPKYINRREIIYDANNRNPINENAQRQIRATLTDSDQRFVQAMDTLWIGSSATRRMQVPTPIIAVDDRALYA